jgi:hypothetical protein
MRKLLVGIVAALAALMLFAGTAAATVTFDPNTGTGFVGKGDVQNAFGWNNAQLQANAGGVTFSYNTTDTYSAVCEFVTGTGTHQQTHDVTIPRHTSVNDTVEYDARTHKQVDGFILTGFGTTSTTGTVPVVGAPCVGNEDGVDHNGTWVSVSGPTSSGGGLFVNYGSNSVLIWP